MRTPWTTIWAACWASLPTARAAAIEEYLSEKVDGLSNGELQGAVEYLANQSTGEEKAYGNTAPSIKQLEYTIRLLRKQKRGIDTSEPYDVTVAKRMIRQAKVDSDERWETICAVFDQHGSAWARKLEDYAIVTGGLTLPWFVSLNGHHKGAVQESKPKGVGSVYEAFQRLANNKSIKHVV